MMFTDVQQESEEQFRVMTTKHKTLGRMNKITNILQSRANTGDCIKTKPSIDVLDCFVSMKIVMI